MGLKSISQATSILIEALSNLWDNTVSTFPSLIAALVIIFVGWVLGKVLRRLLVWLLRKVGLDKWIKRNGLSGAFWGRDFSSVLGTLLKWYVILVFAVQAIALIPIEILWSLTSGVKKYIHFLFGASFAFVFAALAAEQIKKKITSSDLAYGKTLGSIAKFLLMYFLVVLILEIGGISVRILSDVFRIAFMAFAIAVAIIVGVGFGLAYSEDTMQLVTKLRKKKTRR